MGTLTARQEAAVRRRLVLEEQRTADRVAALERDFNDIVEASAEAVRDDEHDPEGATIAFERAQVASLLQDARATLQALQVAAQRLDGPDAGRCERCARAIGYERLLARPSAIRCVACAAAR